VNEVRVNFCSKADHSAGVRKFVRNNYNDLKTLNPSLPFMVQPCDNIKAPFLYFRYGFGAEKTVDLTNLDEFQITDKLKESTIMGQFVPRNNFTLDGEFTPQDIDVVDYALLKKNPMWQMKGAL